MRSVYLSEFLISVNVQFKILNPCQIFYAIPKYAMFIIMNFLMPPGRSTEESPRDGHGVWKR